MTETPKIAWKRLAVEAPVIVISILLAFAIDAWWEERGDRASEIVLLERLQADFLEIRSALRVVVDEHLEARAACLFLMGLNIGEAVPATAEADRMISLVFLASRTFNPGSGALSSFYSSDGARLVRNHVLADKVLAWSALVADLQEEEANLQKGVTERWSPFIASRVSLGPYAAATVDPDREIPEPVSTPAARTPLVVDETFINHVLDRFRWQQIALRDIQPVYAAVEDILALIETELGD
jgi:hypothetical protein